MEDEYIDTYLILDGKIFKMGGSMYPEKGDFVKLGNKSIEIYKVEHEYDFEEDEIIPITHRIYGKEINV